MLAELFEQDLGDMFKIDPSTQGIEHVNLKCGASSMWIQLKTEQDFTGVMYIRGSFYDQKEPCFVKPKRAHGTRSLVMQVPFDECQTTNVSFYVDLFAS